MTNVAIYTRVSSANQADDGASLETQEDHCRQYAADNGWTITGVYTDVHTGSVYRERPGLTELRDTMRAGAVDIVLAYAIDRLSRNQAHLAILDEEARDHHARLEFVTESFEDSAVGRFIRSATAFVAEMEHEKIRERTTRGKIARIQSGRLLATAKPRYGYQWRDDSRGEYDINDPEAVIVRRIFDECLNGKSIRAIAHDLTADGIPTPTGRKPEWAYTTVRNILKNHAYKGDAYGWGNSRSSNGTPQHYDPDRAIKLPDGTIPPIVNTATWDSVQEILTRNKQRAIRNAHEPEAVLLRGGFGKCGYCGWSLMARPRPNDRYEYGCGQTRNHPGACHSHAITAHLLDESVWTSVLHVLLEPGIIEQEIERLTSDDPTSTDLTLIDRALSDISRQRENLSRAIALTDSADATSALVAQLEQLTDRQRALNQERKEILDRREQWEHAQTQLESVEIWRARVAENLLDLSWTEKRLLLDLLNVEARLWRTDHEPRFTVTMTINPRDPLIYDDIVIRTTSRTDHNVDISLRWDDSEIEVATRWSLQYDECTGCNTTARPHKARGMCDRCYRRWWRRVMSKSRHQ